MVLDDIVLVTARDFLETYDDRRFSNAAWFIQRNWGKEYVRKNGLDELTVSEPHESTVKRYSQGTSVPHAINSIFRLEELSPTIIFPLTAASPSANAVSNLFAFVYFSGGITEGTLSPRIYQGERDSQEVLNERLLFPHETVITPQQTYVNMSEVAAPLSRILIALGIEPAGQGMHKADFPNYIKALSSALREPDITSTERDIIRGICMDFATIFLSSKGHLMEYNKLGTAQYGGLRARLHAKSKKADAEKDALDAARFLKELLGMSWNHYTDTKTSACASGEHQIYTPVVSLKRKELIHLLTEYSPSNIRPRGLSLNIRNVVQGTELERYTRR